MFWLFHDRHRLRKNQQGFCGAQVSVSIIHNIQTKLIFSYQVKQEQNKVNPVMTNEVMCASFQFASFISLQAQSLPSGMLFLQLLVWCVAIGSGHGKESDRGFKEEVLTLSKEMKDMEKELNDMRSAHNKLISAVVVSLNF